MESRIQEREKRAMGDSPHEPGAETRWGQAGKGRRHLLTGPRRDAVPAWRIDASLPLSVLFWLPNKPL